MKKFLTNNIGLKIISVISAIILWIVIVNIDDPVIKKSFSGVQVEIINEDAISSKNKTYEILDGSDLISVTVTAKRSVIESMTKDYIKATADLKQLSFMNTIPIEFKSLRFGEQIESITSRTSNVQVEIENKLTKQIRVNVDTTGEVAEGYVVGKITPNVSVISVTGPESVVNKVAEAKILVDLSSMNESFTNSAKVQLWDLNSEIITDEMVSTSMTEIRTEVEILETKEIPIIASSTGDAATGFSPTGTVICEPSSVMVAGLGNNFDRLSSIIIPGSRVNIGGAAENTTKTVNIKSYLPNGTQFADPEFNGDVDITVVVEAHTIMVASILPEDITITNVPEGYVASVANDSTSGINVPVSGLVDSLALLDGYKVTGTVDASTFVPKKEAVSDESEDEEDEDESEIYVGINTAKLILNLPEGVIQVDEIPLEISVAYDGEENTEEEN